MLKLRRINIERSEEVFEKIKAYVNVVVSRLNPQLVILFGSFATGDINEGSDVDILVVADFKEDFLERMGTLMKLNTFGIPIEPLGYTSEEFEENEKTEKPVHPRGFGEGQNPLQGISVGCVKLNIFGIVPITVRSQFCSTQKLPTPTKRLKPQLKGLK